MGRLRLALVLCLASHDAAAWGLQTHLFLAESLVALLPLADEGLRSAARRLPRLVLAGACLPDLALAGRALGTPAFRRAHLWSTLRRIAAAPRDEAEQALALGYASHLATDVVAHNFFVPEHEARIARVPHAVHALAEWAMDHHVGGRPRAAELLAQPEVSPFVAHAFRCDARLAGRTIDFLSRADAWLRASPVPLLCHRLVDDTPFAGWIERALATLAGVEAALNGSRVDWEGLDPERHSGDQPAEAGSGDHVARIVQSQRHA
jgi:hypothetical protein